SQLTTLSQILPNLHILNIPVHNFAFSPQSSFLFPTTAERDFDEADPSPPSYPLTLSSSYSIKFDVAC
ncbi:hypothetical protein LINPERHAP1_LOCUS26641, partial [Linum perenne]